jgi:AcrR family transcriptional regulator
MLVKPKLTRKQQIEKKATELFQQNGYAATSMRDLARFIGIEAASLYSHIKSKEEILQSICFRLAEEFFEAMQSVEEEGLKPDEQIRRAIVAHVQVITDNPSASAVFFSEWRHLSEPFMSDFLAMRDQYEGRIQQILEEGIATEMFKPMDTKFTVLALLSSINWIPSWYQPDGKLGPEDIARNVTNVFIDGLKVR